MRGAMPSETRARAPGRGVPGLAVAHSGAGLGRGGGPGSSQPAGPCPAPGNEPWPGFTGVWLARREPCVGTVNVPAGVDLAPELCTAHGSCPKNMEVPEEVCELPSLKVPVLLTNQTAFPHLELRNAIDEYSKQALPGGILERCVGRIGHHLHGGTLIFNTIPMCGFHGRLYYCMTSQNPVAASVSKGWHSARVARSHCPRSNPS